MVHVYISGNVQGIGFRQFVKYKAKKLNLRGWIKNLPDGRVETVFAGDLSNIEKMVELCRKGPFLAEVKKVDVDWNYKSSTDIIDFEVIK